MILIHVMHLWNTMHFVGRLDKFENKGRNGSVGRIFLEDSNSSLCFFTGCNETLTGVNGSFHSPNYPTKYPDGQFCSWRITVSSWQQIHLTFTHFSLQSENNTDSLHVYDGENATGEVLGVFYGCHPPPKEGIYSSSNHLLVIFKSDKDISQAGFSASYVAVNCSSDSCSTSITSTSTVETSGPSKYPMSFSTNLHPSATVSFKRETLLTPPMTVPPVMTSFSNQLSKPELGMTTSITYLAMASSKISLLLTSSSTVWIISSSRTQAVITSPIAGSAAQTKGLNTKSYKCTYSGTRLIRTPRGHTKVSVLTDVRIKRVNFRENL